jgi:hypothetical protein
VVWHVDIVELMGRAAQVAPESLPSVLDDIGDVLDKVVGSAPRWSSAPGVIDIHSTATAEAVELKRAVLIEALNKRLRGVPNAAQRDGDIRRVDAERFRAICAKAQARAEQIHDLNVAEALFGRGDDNQKIGPRMWRRVEQIVDQSLAKVGYATLEPPGRLHFFFPGYSAAMGDMKCRAIAQDVAALTAGQPDETDAAADNSPADNGPGRPAASASRREAIERARLNRAVADRAAARNADTGGPSPLAFPAGYGARTHPMWLAKKRAVAGAVIKAIRHDERAEANVEAPEQGLDLPLLARAARQIDALRSTGKSSLMIAPVAWEYLDQPRSRQRYIEFCANLPEAARHLLVLELVGMPEEMMSARVSERVNQLRRVCRSVICRVRIARRDFSQFDKVPIYAVGISLDELPHYERGIIPAFDAFMDAAEAQNLKVYVNGISSKSMLVAAQAAGVEFVSGPIIPEVDATPLGIRDFQISDLYGAPPIDDTDAEG